MALHGNIGQSEVSVKCIKMNGHVYELACKGAVTITRSINTASTFKATAIRDVISVEKGDTIDFTLDGQHHQFFGIVLDIEYADEWITFTAYDQIWYLNKNKRHISYENITLNQLLERICTDRKYAMSDPPQFEDTVHVLPARVEENTTELAIITNAIEALYPISNVKYFLWDDAGYLRLNSSNWLAGEPSIIVSNEYFESYSITDSAQDGYSVVRMEEKAQVQQPQPTDTAGQEPGKEGQDKQENEQKTYENKTYLAVDPYTNDKYGTIEHYQAVAEGENGQWMVDHLVAELSKNFDKVELTINGCQGDITVRGGTPLLVDMFTTAHKEYIRGWYEVQNVTHTIEAGYHKMDMTLKCMKSLDEWDNTDPNYYSHWALN